MKNKKLFVSILASLLGLVSVGFNKQTTKIEAEDEPKYSIDLTGATAIDSSWTGITVESGSYYLPAGTYYLEEDVIVDKSIIIKNNDVVNLCLNSKILNFNETLNYNIGLAGTLNIYDKGNTIHKYKENEDHRYILDDSGDISIAGGAIYGKRAQDLFVLPTYNADTMKINMYGGSIIACATIIGTTCCDGTRFNNFTMYDGLITGCNTDVYIDGTGYGSEFMFATNELYCYGGKITNNITAGLRAADIRVGGDAYVYNNIAYDDYFEAYCNNMQLNFELDVRTEDGDICTSLDRAKVCIITEGEHKIKEGAYFGINVQDDNSWHADYQFTDALDGNYSSYFAPNTKQNIILNEDNSLSIVTFDISEDPNETNNYTVSTNVGDDATFKWYKLLSKKTPMNYEDFTVEGLEFPLNPTQIDGDKIVSDNGCIVFSLTEEFSYSYVSISCTFECTETINVYTDDDLENYFTFEPGKYENQTFSPYYLMDTYYCYLFSDGEFSISDVYFNEYEYVDINKEWSSTATIDINDVPEAGSYACLASSKTYANQQLTSAILTFYEVDLFLDIDDETTAFKKVVLEGTALSSFENDIKSFEERKGYDFEGWYLDNNYQDQLENFDSAIVSNITIYGKWTAKDYSISYILYDGENSLSNKDSYTIEDSNITLSEPTKNGYNFNGWYTEETFENKVTEIDTSKCTDVVLYAKWTPIEYLITYYLDEGVNAEANPNSYTIEDSNITLGEPTKNGYNFDGWYTEETFENKVTEIDTSKCTDVVLYAKWTAKTFTITYDTGNGENDSENPLEYSADGTITLKKATKNGYNFEGWYLDPNFEHRVNSIDDLLQFENITLYAKWSATEYTITYNIDGGDNSSLNPAIYTIEDSNITLGEPTKEGYVFEGWYTEETFENKVTEIDTSKCTNVTLYAKFSPVSTGLGAGYTALIVVACVLIILVGLYFVWKHEYEKAIKNDENESRKLKFLDIIYKPIYKIFHKNAEKID